MSSEAGELAVPSWRDFDSGTLRADVLAGITVSLVAVPQSLAYAQLAGVPPIYGLYAALIPSVIGALAGSSAILSTGPVAMTSLLTAASIAPLAGQGTEQFYTYAVLLALLSGLFQLGFGVLRMGVLLNFLSHPVLMGFINAAAIIIGLSQLPTLLGVSTLQTEHFLLDIVNVLERSKELEPLAFGFGIASMVALAFFKAKLPKWPGVLITVATLTLASAYFEYEKLGGKVVGAIPQGLPSFGVPRLEWAAALALLPASFVIALISFMEAMSSSKIIAIRTRNRWDENRELIGQGLAKIAAAFCLSMPVSGSFSRSALNLSAGAQTKLSSLVAAGFVGVTLLFLTPLLYHLPKPVLAAIIMMAVTNLVNIRIIRNAWRANLDDGVAGTVTFVATLLFAPNIQNGILTGILLSLALMLYRLMKPRIAVLGLKDGASLRDNIRHKVEPLGAQLGAIRFDGALLFINVSYFEDALIDLERQNPQMSHILVKCSGINRIDASGIEMLFNVVGHFKTNGVTLVFSGLKEQCLDVMGRSGLIRDIGAENIYATDRLALEALRRYWDRDPADGGQPRPAPTLTPLVAEPANENKTVAVRPLFDAARPIRVLVPVDGRAESLRAVEAAIAMVKGASGGSLVLLNTQSASVDNDSVNVFVSHSLEEQEHDRSATVALKSGTDLCERAGVSFKTRKERGQSAKLIASVASDEDVDQIVMAKSAAASGFFGRTLSSHVIDLAKMPVTVIK